MKRVLGFGIGVVVLVALSYGCVAVDRGGRGDDWGVIEGALSGYEDAMDCVTEVTVWSPLMCRTPTPTGPRLSEAVVGSDHGRKLYHLFATDGGLYERASVGAAEVDMLFGDLAVWFTGPALFGTVFLFIQLVAGQLGGDAADLDFDLDVDTDGGGAGAEFSLISLQSMSAFFMGYGWIGFAAYRFLNLDFTGSAVTGVGAGIAIAWLMVWVIRNLMKLQSDSNVSIRMTEGLVGKVQITIPAKGEGKGEVVMVMHQNQHSFAAVQEGGEKIGMHSRVRVVRADVEGNVLIVERE